MLAAGAGPRLPVAIRIALRDLVRYRARSGAALAATTFAVFLAMAICLVASIQFGNPLNWFGSNLSSSQLIVYTQRETGARHDEQLSNAQLASLGRQVDSYAAGLHAQSVLPLEASGVGLYQVGTQGPHDHFNGSVYVATPQLLATYGIKASQISPGTDILTMRPGLTSLPHMELTWGTGRGALLLLVGLVATVVGICLLAPLAIGVMASGASPRLPVAIRVALRDLVRYRARSGAHWRRYVRRVPGHGDLPRRQHQVRQPARLDQPQPDQQPADHRHPAESGSRHDDAARQRPGHQPQRAGKHSRRQPARAAVVPLESTATMYQAGAPAHQNFTGTVYVATPRLLGTYGIKASQIAPGTDILTMRPGLAALPHMEMVWHICTGLCHAGGRARW